MLPDYGKFKFIHLPIYLVKIKGHVRAVIYCRNRSYAAEWSFSLVLRADMGYCFSVRIQRPALLWRFVSFTPLTTVIELWNQIWGGFSEPDWCPVWKCLLSSPPGCVSTEMSLDIVFDTAPGNEERRWNYTFWKCCPSLLLPLIFDGIYRVLLILLHKGLHYQGGGKD